MHVLDDPWSRSLVARLSHPDTHAPVLHQLLEAGTRHLLAAACEHLPTHAVVQPTRMTAVHPGHSLHTSVLAPDAAVVIADIARGGIVPSYVVQQELLRVLHPAGVRVDHIYMQRVAGDDGSVVGVHTSGSKIGGPVAGATLIVPDPMGATGSSMDAALRLYASLAGGPPAQVITLHLVITPEFLRRLTTRWPDAHVYALRLDRGLSPADVLASVPGARWDEERGLDDHDYVVPGLGGLGELVNNAFI